MRDSSIFYRSFYEAIKSLPETNQLEVYNAIFEYSFNFNEVELVGLSSTIFTLIKPQLEANNKRFENGLKPKQKQNGSKTEAKVKQKTSKVEANKNVNVNKNDNNNLELELWFEQFSKKENWQNLWNSWIDYKKTQFKFIYKSKQTEKTAIQELFKLSNRNFETAEKIVNNSMANGYKGLFELKTQPEINDTQIKSMLQKRKDDAAKLLNNENVL